MEIKRDTIVVHTGELVLKGGNRGMFERKLIETIAARLKPIGTFKVVRRQGTIFATTATPLTDEQADAARAALSKIFGICAFLIAAHCERDIAVISEVAAAQLRPLAPTTFKVRGKRSDKSFPMNSQDFSAEVGARLLAAVPGTKVDVHNPETSIYVQIDEKDALVAVERSTGEGGLPSGTSGKVVALLSGGIDSPVAAWKIMSRGCKTTFVHFHSYPHVGKESLAKARRLAQTLAEWQGASVLYLVPLAGIQREIVAKADPSMRVILYRRAMLRLAERIAANVGAMALVTGDAVGQVASQTIENIATVSAAATMPVLRPLSGDDKESIIAVARRIGTFETSIEPHDDCCSVFMPPRAATKSTAEYAASEEAKCDLAPLMDTAITEAERVEIASS